jgi:hypothetical protein
MKKSEKFDFVVVSFSENNRSLIEAVLFCQKMNAVENKGNFRINPSHKNIVEIKGKSKKWAPMTVFIDPSNQYVPKGKYQTMGG